MTKFIRNHQKKFLAIFLALLMVVFLINRGPGGGGGPDRIAAYIGKQPVYESEIATAQHEWKLLKNIRELRYGEQSYSPVEAYLGPSLANEIDNKDELFYLLQKEAEKEGVVPDQQFIAQIAGDAQGPDPEENRQAARGLALVAGLRDQLANAIQLSEPMERHELAATTQKARLCLVTYKADQFKSSIPTPTADQLRQQYDRYKNIEPMPPLAGPISQFQAPPAPAPGDPLGFGYELPRRVKLQYIEISRQSVMDEVAKTKNAYDWEVDARKYYYGHIDQYPTTLPGTNPATLPTSQPYVEVRQSILDQLRSPDADALEQKVRDAVFDRLHGDWDAYAAMTRSATQSAFGPATRPTANPMASIDYLKKVADDVSKRLGVKLTVHDLSDYESAQDLALEPGIGFSSSGETRFADYAIGSDEPSKQAKNLHLLQPSNWLNDDSNNSFIFRLTAVAPAAPQPFAAVQATVAADWVTQQCYDKAVAAARDLADKSKGKVLQFVAVAAGMPAFYTGYFQPGSERIPGDVMEKVVEKAAENDVNAKAASLLSLATPADPHPVGIVELPMLSSRSVIVVQLADTTSALPPGSMWRQQLRDSAYFARNTSDTLASAYFNYDAVAKRLGYKPQAEQKGS